MLELARTLLHVALELIARLAQPLQCILVGVDLALQALVGDLQRERAGDGGGPGDQRIDHQGGGHGDERGDRLQDALGLVDRPPQGQHLHQVG